VSRDFYRIFIGSDVHGGHFAGLTPPEWHYPRNGAFGEIAAMQMELWDFFSSRVDALKPFDAAFWVGDMIEGDGDRNSGVELVTTDRLNQCQIAIGAVRKVGAKKNRFIYGTPSHTGKAEDFERMIADEFKAKITAQAWMTKYGVTFNLKHKVGGTGVPHGKGTAIGKEVLWGTLWAEMLAQPKANITVRGHTHRYYLYDDIGPNNTIRMGVCLPALQAAATKYGAKECSGIVHFGFMHFDIYPDGEVTWKKHVLNVKTAVPEVEEL
jgi:hypothetical protein